MSEGPRHTRESWKETIQYKQVKNSIKFSKANLENIVFYVHVHIYNFACLKSVHEIIYFIRNI